MPKLLLLIVGLPGSGKTTVTNFLAKKFSARVFHSGNIIREEIKKRNLPYTPENDKKIANWFHSQRREHLIADKTWKKISPMKSKIIIVEGFRNLKQYSRLLKLNKTKKVFSKIILISVNAPFKIRAQRELSRGRFSRGETLAYIRSRDKTETSHGLKKLIAKAKFKINSSGSLMETEMRSEKILMKILKL